MYRSPRVFQRQYQLLLTTSLLERAERELTAVGHDGNRRRKRQLERETERLWDVVESIRRQLVEPEWWRLGPDDAQYRHIAPSELIHPRLRVYIGPGSSAVDAGALEAGPQLARRAVEQLTIGAAIVAIFATILQVAVHGVHDRPMLIVSEIATLVLVPVAAWLSAEWSRRREP